MIPQLFRLNGLTEKKKRKPPREFTPPFGGRKTFEFSLSTSGWLVSKIY